MYYQRLNQLQEAERFMSLSLQLNGFCGDFLSVEAKGGGERKTYTQEMNENYATLLSKI